MALINSTLGQEATAKIFWKSKLENCSPILFPRDLTDTNTGERGLEFLDFSSEKSRSELLPKIKQKSEGFTFEFFLSIFKILIYKYTGQEDICIGSTFLETEEKINKSNLFFFPTRNHLNGDLQINTLIEAVKNGLTESEPFHYNIQNIISINNQTEQFNIKDFNFPVNFVFKKKADNLQIEPNIIEPFLNYSELILEVTENPDSFNLRFYFSPSLFLSSTIERMAEHYLQILESVTNNEDSTIGRIRMLYEKEEKHLLKDLNETFREIPNNKTVLDLFEDQVGRNPHATAIIFEDNKITYVELNKKSNQLAFFLKNSGVKNEDLVPICLERSLEMAIAILGVLKANAAFVPIDPGFPKDRINYMIADTNASLILASSNTKELIEERGNLILIDQLQELFKNGQELEVKKPEPDQLAYVIYTSGSTGKPKGVMIEHHNLLNFLTSMTVDVEFTSSSSILSVTTYSFDIFYLELFLPLINGCQVFLASRKTAMDGFKLAEMIRQFKPTHMQATPSGWRLLLDTGWKNDEKVKMLVGGEALKEDVKNALTEIGELWNLYGPTETTIWSTFKKLNKNDKITVGKPIANTFIYILGKDNSLNPVGLPGELCIGGKGVGRGYLNRPELTSEKFITNPFQPEVDPKIYRTGDLAKWLPNGDIECLGRIDDQVKIRGYRVETGEIESVIIQNLNVKQASVAAKDDQSGIKRLVAYVVTNEDFNRQNAIQILKDKLPEYMVPLVWVQMEKLPLTFNGKINKKELPTPTFEESINENFVEPVTENEKKLAALWCRILGLQKVGIENDFFALGGHSLAAMRLAAMVRKEMQLELQLQDIFTNPTIRTLSQKLSEIKTSENKLSEIVPGDNIPLSFNQESLWFIDRLKGSLHYHLPLIFKIEGNLNEKILRQTFLSIIDRHQILKTGFTEDNGSPIQKIINPVKWDLEIITSESFNFKEGTPAFSLEVASIIYRPFDLEKDVKLRATLIKSGKEENILIVVLHHIVSDGWSMNILKSEISEVYRALLNKQDNILAPLEVQYSQFSIWERELMADEWLEREIPFWLEKLNGLEPLQMPTDFPRPPLQSTSGGMVRFHLNANFTEKLNLLGQGHGATLFMTLLAAFKIFLHKYSSQEDICVGTPIAGRDLPELEELIGFFINSVPIRTSFDSEISFSELLDRVKFNTLEAFEHRQVPFEKIVEVKSQERDLSMNPIFQAMFVLQNMPEDDLSFPDAQITELPHLHQSAVTDITFELTQKNGALDGTIEFSTDLFTSETAERMASHYQKILEEVLSNPNIKLRDIGMLTKTDIEQVLEKFNQNFKSEFPPINIIELFQNQVNKSPDAIAIEFGEKFLTYAELDKKSNQLAHYLQKKGIGKEDKVPICLDRSLEMMLGIWGILKSGAAYVPIDPTYPSERIKYVLEDLHAELILTNSDSKNSVDFPSKAKVIDLENDWNLIEGEPTDPIKEKSSPEDLAYVIYTSGSTGQPKGVLIEHKGLSSSTLARISYYKHMGATLLVPSFAFDSSVAVIFGTLVMGGKLILCKSSEIKNPYQIKHLIKKTEELLCVPSYYRFLLEEDLLKDSALKRVVLAGENLDEKLVAKHFSSKPTTKLFNEYGPTEGTVWASVTEILPETKNVTIGKPIDNTVVYIIGKNGNIHPSGIPGELCIAGSGISRGYLNQPELTAKKFVKDPFSPNRSQMLYRTGDLAKWLPDGTIEYLGRSDDQIKIRGFRVELGEIEARLNQIEEVEESVVILREDEPGEKLLVAYVVCAAHIKKPEELNLIGHLREKLKNTLPDYMVPNDWVLLEKLPLTSNNKIDRKNLPKPKRTNQVFSAPKSDSEILVAKIWSKCLSKENLDVRTDFFENGGHSLLAVKAMSLLEKETGTKYPLNTIFKHPILLDFAKFLDEFVPDKSDWSALVPIKPTGSKPPLYLVHGVSSGVGVFFKLSNYIEEDQPLYGFQPVGMNGVDKPHSSIEEMAAHYVSLMIKNNPEGPYYIGGYSFGGYVGFEMIKQLHEMGKVNTKYIILDTPAFPNPRELSKFDQITLEIKHKLVNYLIFSWKEPKGFFENLNLSIDRNITKFLKISGLKDEKKSNIQMDILHMLRENNIKILNNYHLSYFPMKAYLIRTNHRAFYVENSKHYGWKKYVDELIPITTSGHHENFFQIPKHLKTISEKIKDILNSSD